MALDMISFSLTSQAKVVVSERNAHLNWIQKILDNPARTETDTVDPELLHIKKRVPLSDLKQLQFEGV